MLHVPWAMIILLGLHCAAAEQIDPKVYAKLFMNNKPLFDAMAAKVSEKLPASGKVLDLGSGPGEPSLTLAKMSPSSKVVCTDFQQAMVDKAKSRVEGSGATNVEFAQTSADDLSAWTTEFDAVMMSFVLMFVPDKAKALQEVARVLKPGGYAYTAVWKHLPFYALAHDAVEEVAGKPMPEFAINPLKLKADNAVEDLAGAAGLEIIGQESLSYDFKMDTAKETADGCTILAGGMLKQLEEDGISGATSKFYKVVERLIDEKNWKASGGEVSVPGNSPQLLTLRKPLKDEL